LKRRQRTASTNSSTVRSSATASASSVRNTLPALPAEDLSIPLPPDADANYGMMTWLNQRSRHDLNQSVAATFSVTSIATRSCRDPGTAVIHFWLPGCVRRRRQRVTSAADATRYGRRRFCYGRAPPLQRLLLVLLYSQCGD